MDPIGYAKSHPFIVGGAVFAIGAAFLIWRSSSSGGQSTDAGLASAYYGAIAADKTAYAALETSRINAGAAVTLAGIQADAYTHVQEKWADTSLATVESNNETQASVAPYMLTSQYLDTLGHIASAPPIVTTKKSSGFFGIGGGSKQVVTQNPNAAAAGATLAGFDLTDYMHGFLNNS